MKNKHALFEQTLLQAVCLAASECGMQGYGIEVGWEDEQDLSNQHIEWLDITLLRGAYSYKCHIDGLHDFTLRACMVQAMVVFRSEADSFTVANGWSRRRAF